MTAADMADLSRVIHHVGVVAGYLAVAALLVFAGVSRRWSDDALLAFSRPVPSVPR